MAIIDHFHDHGQFVAFSYVSSMSRHFEIESSFAQIALNKQIQIHHTMLP